MGFNRYKYRSRSDAPNRKSVNVRGESTLHIVNGKVTKEIVAYDNQEFIENLGYTMTPPPAPKRNG
jgi:hypothetical protein